MKEERQKKRRTLSPEARAAMSRGAVKACAERWGGRGDGVRIYVDREAAEALEAVAEIDRRAVASAGIRMAAWAYANAGGKAAKDA